MSVCALFHYGSLPVHLLIMSCVAAVDDLFGGTIPAGNGLDDEDAASADVVSLDGARSKSLESSFFVVISLTSCIEISFDSLIFQTCDSNSGHRFWRTCNIFAKRQMLMAQKGI